MADAPSSQRAREPRDGIRPASSGETEFERDGQSGRQGVESERPFGSYAALGTTFVQAEDPLLELRERASGHGLRRAIGELLSCPYCLDQWIAGAFIGGLVFAPRPTRATAGMFAAVTGSDYLQHLHRWVMDRG